MFLMHGGTCGSSCNRDMNFQICSYFRRFLRRARFAPRHNGRRLAILICLLLALVTILLHLLILPAVSGAYNDECCLSESKLSELRYLILTSAKLMEKYNMTYWLDFGTLLGAVKYGDVLPWDGDADISSIYHQEFNPSTLNAEFATSYGIHRNGLIAQVNNTQLDYYRWTVTDGTFNGIQEKVLKSYYPKWITDSDNVLVKLEHSRETIPLSWVVPTKKIDFAGASVAVPKEYEKVLDSRYPLTYRYGIFTPYKWKCWFPSWFTGGKSCKKPFAKRRKQTII